MSVTSKPTVDQLREQVRATVITADDPGYDEARAVHNGMFDKYPKVVIRAGQVADVIAAVNFARDAGLELAVRGGGHSAPGFGTCDGGVVIDLSLMRSVYVDPKAGTARPAAEPPGGTSTMPPTPTGWRPPAASSPLPVSADSRSAAASDTCPARTACRSTTCARPRWSPPTAASWMASAEENADLFWALRGGGGNFGVVTSFEFALHPVADIYAGIFFYDLEYARDLLKFFADFIPGAPEAYGAFPAFQIAPPLEFIPADRVGDTFCAAIVHWSGPVGQGEKAMEPFRAIAPVVAEMVAPMPYPALNSAFDALFPKGIRSYWKGSFVTELTDAAIEQHISHGPRVPEVSATMHLYPINGACHRVGADETAFAYRDATFAQVILAAWHDPADDQQRIGWVRDYHQATAPYSEPGGYVNFMADDDSARVQDNYRRHYTRLADIKRAYDPGNLFHLNQNIPPAS